MKLRAVFSKFCLVLAIFTTACSTTGYWVPPSGPRLQQTPAVQAQPTLAVPAIPLEPVSDPAVSSPAAPTPTETLPAAANPPTPAAQPSAPPPASPTQPEPTFPPPTATAPPAVNTAPILYYAQAADTLPVVAVRFGVQPEEITSTDPLPAAAFLNPGQLLLIPRRLGNTTSSQRLLPDSEVVYSPSATDFDVNAFVQQAGGKLSTLQEWHKSTGFASGAEILKRVALENSINPRLLLSLLEYESGWVYGQPANAQQRDYPLGLKDPNQDDLYSQLVWSVNQLSIGYYAWREGRLTEISFPGGVTARLHPELNAGTVALLYFFSRLTEGQDWLNALDTNGGFPALHARMFGDPWARAATVEPLFPTGITQPPLILPFQFGLTWSYTGGPHGAWEHDGSYAAIDFAPGTTKPGCERSTAWATAAASGLVVREGNGVLVLDLDGDGSEQTGWVLVYLHLSNENRIPVGSPVSTGDPLGHPSCEGGFATGTHLHIARKYNGEWIPADGPLPFNLEGWVVHAGEVAYKGTMERDGQVIKACTCSSAETFITRTAATP